MRTIFNTLAIAILVVSVYSCQPAEDDFEAREEKLSKEIEKMNVQSVYRDLLMLYFDLIEDVYNEGVESGNFDVKRIEAFQEGIMTDFFEKLDTESREFWEEEDDKSGESLADRLLATRPMIVEMMGESEYDDSQDLSEMMLPDSSFVIGGDTIKELENGDIILNGDTMTVDEYLQKIGYNE